MKRYAANILYCSPNNPLKNGVVEIDERTGTITDIFSLNEKGDEVHSAVFFNGILLPFNPFFSSEMNDSNLFQLLEEQFASQVSCEMARNKKTDLWLLQGDDLFCRQIPGKNWRVTAVYEFAEKH
jgi:hypothetical protein